MHVDGPNSRSMVSTRRDRSFSALRAVCPSLSLPGCCQGLGIIISKIRMYAMSSVREFVGSVRRFSSTRTSSSSIKSTFSIHLKWARILPMVQRSQCLRPRYSYFVPCLSFSQKQSSIIFITIDENARPHSSTTRLQERSDPNT
jgi:hypothetical protein